MKTEAQWLREENMAKNKRIKELIGEGLDLATAYEEAQQRIAALEAALTEATDGVFICDDDFPTSMPQYLYDKLKALLPGVSDA